MTYTSYYLRRTFRQDGKVKHETLGNLSDLPLHVIDLISRSLKGETFVPAADAFHITRSLPHGHVEAVLKMIRKLALYDGGVILATSEIGPRSFDQACPWSLDELMTFEPR